MKENVSIPNTDNLAEILNATISLVDKDIKISYNKILAKSEIELSSFNALILIYLFSNKFRFSALHNFIILHIILKQM